MPDISLLESTINALPPVAVPAVIPVNKSSIKSTPIASNPLP